jgi:hypothetical protein
MPQRPEEPGTPADEARAAAEEAAEIGGPDPYPDLDPAERPIAEGGGGEAEGFEQAEEELMRNASHDDAHGHPEADRFSPEVEADLSGAEYAEADEYGDHEEHGELVEPDDEDR